jgi:hypothetical protein
MLTKATTFDEALELASAGDSRKVNLLVKYEGELVVFGCLMLYSTKKITSQAALIE